MNNNVILTPVDWYLPLYTEFKSVSGRTYFDLIQQDCKLKNLIGRLKRQYNKLT